MFICYTHRYNNQKGESHRLLGKAAALYLEAGNGADGMICLDDQDLTAGPEYMSRAEALVHSLVRGEHGKPYIPEFAEFSISHSNNTWAVLIDETECGLDIQYPRRADRSGIAGRFYHPDDAKQVRRQPESFFRIWSRREALIKAAGTTVADTDLPSVLQDDIVYRGREYRLGELTIPGAPDLYASVSIAGQER